MLRGLQGHFLKSCLQPSGCQLVRNKNDNFTQANYILEVYIIHLSECNGNDQMGDPAWNTLVHMGIKQVPGTQKHSGVVLRAHVCLAYLWVCGFVIIVHSKKPPLAIASACSSLFREHSLGYSLSCKKECIPATCILCTKSSFNLSCSFHYSIISFFFPAVICRASFSSSISNMLLLLQPEIAWGTTAFLC